MANFFNLLKIQLNARYGFSMMRYSMKNDKKALWRGIGLGLVLLLALLEVMGLYVFFLIELYKAGEALGAPQFILTMATVAAGLLILFFGIFYILSTLFLAKDTELLASLPVSQESIFTSKFMMVLIGEYPFAFLIMLPPVIIYGVNMHKGPFYYLLALLGTLILPLIPLILSALTSLILMNVVSRSKRRDLITILGSIVFLVGVVAGQNYLLSRMPSNGTEFMLALIQNSQDFIAFMGRAFPPSVWITRMLSSDVSVALYNLGYLLLSSAVAFVLVYYLASRIYTRGATAHLETRAKQGSKKLNYKSSSQILALFKNEWRIILRTPIYVLNSLTSVIMAPLILMLPLFGGNLANDPDIKFVLDLIRKAEAQSGLLLILSGVVSLFALINPAVSSTFSREGKQFWILKNIPVAPEIQVYGKLLAGYSISFLAVLLSVIGAMISFKLSPLLALMVILLCSLAMIPVSALSLLIDLIRPKLAWNNPQEAIKQNMNVVLGMLVGFLVLSLLGVLGYFLISSGLSLFALFGVMLIVLILASYFSVMLLKKNAQKFYHKIEA